MAEFVALNDPAGLLEGTGKRLRHIKIKSVGDAARKEVRNLLNASVAQRVSAVRST
jgi:hypothetical protein